MTMRRQTVQVQVQVHPHSRSNNLPPASCLCRLTSSASPPPNGYESAIPIHKTNLSFNGECVFQSNFKHLLCSSGAMGGEERRASGGMGAEDGWTMVRLLVPGWVGAGSFPQPVWVEAEAAVQLAATCQPPKLSIKSDKCEENGSRRNRGLFY